MIDEVRAVTGGSVLLAGTTAGRRRAFLGTVLPGIVAGAIAISAGLRLTGALIMLLVQLVGWVVFHPGWSGAGLAATVALVSAVLAQGYAGVDAQLVIAGCACVLICLLPMSTLRRQLDAPAMQMFGLLTAAYVVVGVLLSRSEHALIEKMTTSERVAGLVLTGAFTLFLFAGTMLVRHDGRSDDPIEWVPRTDRILWTIALGYVLAIGVTISGVKGALGAAGTALDLVRLVGLLALYLALLRKAVPARAYAVLAAGVAVEALLGIGQVEVYAAAFTPITLLALFVAERRRVPWVIVTLGVTIALLLNVTKHEYRVEVLERGRTSTAQEGVGYLTKFKARSASLGATDLSISAARFAYSTSDVSGYVSRVAPRSYPHWGARSYKSLLVALVPRAVVPSKPNFNYGNQFGREFGLLGPQDTVTAQNLPMASEAYISFGWVGVVVAGVSVGLVVGALQRRFSGRRPEMLLMAALIAGQFLRGVESDSTQAVAFLPVIVIVFPFLTRWVASPQVASAPGKRPGLGQSGKTSV